jgi:lipoate-protein ligase A
VNWEVEWCSGLASQFHARPLPEPVRRCCWVFSVQAPAVVLGSAQPAEHLLPVAVEVVKRRSGGGAVWLTPGEVVWVDLVIPRGDPLWHDDIGRATWWVGERWAEVVSGALGQPAEVHRGGLVRTPWSGRVCFAGLGPGEVTVDGYKVVGISQRRTREGARFQCAALLRWRPEALIQALALTPVERVACAATLADAAAGLHDLGAVIPVQEFSRRAVSALIGVNG